MLVLSNGDTLHGKLVKVDGGKLTFHSEALGDVDVSWDHIKEVHSTDQFGVLQKGVKLSHKKDAAAQIPTGSVDVADQAITLHAANAAPAPIPVANAAYVMDAATIQKQFHEPSFLVGWNGAATAGATLVQATQNQYTVSGALSLVRLVPTVNWLDPRNRTMFDFLGSYGKITEPGVPTTKSSIFHIDGERDQYFTPRMQRRRPYRWPTQRMWSIQRRCRSSSTNRASLRAGMGPPPRAQRWCRPRRINTRFQVR